MSESHERIDALLEERGEDLCYLYDRWQDEQKYEDFAEYREAAQRIIPHPITKMTQRPFAIYFSAADRDYNVRITSSDGIFSIDYRWRDA
jgi:hypothetical protein